MKKFFVGLSAVMMLIAGLVGVSGVQASAVEGGVVAAKKCKGPYAGSIRTDTQVRARSKKPRQLKVRAHVNAPGNAQPTGRIKIQVKGNDKYRQKIRKAPTAKATFRLPPGVYLVQAKYIPGCNSVFNRSEESTIVTVRGRRR